MDLAVAALVVLLAAAGAAGAWYLIDRQAQALERRQRDELRKSVQKHEREKQTDG